MTDTADAQPIYPPPPEFADKAWADTARYKSMYADSVSDPDAFWRDQAQRIDWFEPFQTVKNTRFTPGDVSIKWFEEGVTNACHNAVDRHVESRGDQAALLWEGDEPGDSDTVTYRALHKRVQTFANVLKSMGAKKGTFVTLYMPMIPEAVIAMLACARIGAPHSVVFGGFSPEALASRVGDCNSPIVITADEGPRGGKIVPLKANVDAALEKGAAACVEHVLVVRRTGGDIGWVDGRDQWLHEAEARVDADCPCEPMHAEDPLFVLYTSGSTGKPKGVVHTTGGYQVWTSITHQYVFDCHDGDVYWCAADVGWITGHSYIAYAPLINGSTQIIFEGTPTYPTVNRLAQIIDKHQVSVLYTAPTAIRALMRFGSDAVEGTSRSSLKVLGTVGEPINPEAWNWYYNTYGDARCPIVDTWWQTETGGHMLTPLPGATTLKPGSATKPFFGVQPVVVDSESKELDGACEGHLCIADSWPGQCRTVFGDHQRFMDVYFSTHKGLYFTGDGVRRDADGDYWITGRVDDVINVSGHRLGTAEVESALVAHPAVAEAAVVGFPHDLKGQGIYAYVSLTSGAEESDALRAELVERCREDIGPIGKPDLIQFADGLPKTRSGKIMRRILRKIAADDFGALGDTSTLAEPEVVDALIEGRLNRG